MKADLQTLGLILSIVANLLGLFIWYNTAQHKRFASQVEFQKLAENQRSILALLKEMEKTADIFYDTDSRVNLDTKNLILREISSIRAIMNALIIKLTNQSISGFLGEKQE